MPTAKARFDRRLRRWILPSRIAEYALETGLSTWSLFIGVNMITGVAPSQSLDDLPAAVGIIWAILMMLAGATIATGVFIMPRSHTISRGMYLMGATLLAYSVAVVGAAHWVRGGAIAGFLFVIGSVCLLRGWWLKDRDAALEKELAREHEGN